MEPRDRASNLEFWSGRGRGSTAGEDPTRPLPSFRSARLGRFARLPRVSGSRARPVAAAVLIAGLTAAWLVVGRHTPASDARPASDDLASSVSTSSAPPPAPSTSVPVTVPVTGGCRGLTPARPEVRCVIDAVAVDVRLVPVARVGAAYRLAAAADVAARTGAPACAHGMPDERAWSAVAAPGHAIGRYRCRLEHGRAAMWWTHADRLVHAVARDGDLAGLFTWWRSHPVE